MGNDGPYISRSKRPTLSPLFFKPQAIFEATVDLPTPPLPLAIAITFFTSGRIGSII